MDQHVVSEWLLRAFADRSSGRRTLHLFDKDTLEFQVTDPDSFLTEVDAHPLATETEIGLLEAPAAQAALRLAKRLRQLPAGLYSTDPTDDGLRVGSDSVSDRGVIAGIRLLVTENHLPSPRRRDRLALARYAALMYQRAPNIERAIVEMGLAYDAAAQAALDVLRPGTRTQLATVFAERRFRMVRTATDIGERLAAASWFVVRTRPGQAFVLSDAPVAATLALGHHDVWRPMLSSESYAVVMPIGPSIALVLAPQGVVPISGINIDGLPSAINRLVWGWADRYVLARKREDLEAVWANDHSDRRRERVDAVTPLDVVAMAARRDVSVVVMEVMWRHWDSCRLKFGYAPFASDDRARVMG